MSTCYIQNLRVTQCVLGKHSFRKNVKRVSTTRAGREKKKKKKSTNSLLLGREAHKLHVQLFTYTENDGKRERKPKKDDAKNEHIIHKWESKIKKKTK